MVRMDGSSVSPYQQLRRIEFVIQGCRPGQGAERAALKAYDGLLRQVQLTQQAVRDFELAEVKDDVRAQLRALPRVVKALDRVRLALLKASEFDLIGAVDVAQISAQLDEMSDRLR